MKKWLQVIVSLVMVLSMVMGTTTVFAETDEMSVVTFEAPLMEGFGVTVKSFSEEPLMRACSAIFMLLEMMENDEIDTTTLVNCDDMWVATMGETIRCIYLTSDAMHLVDYTPNQLATYAWASVESADADTMQLVLDEKVASGEFDTLHYCTQTEVTTVFSVLEDLANE